MFHTIYLPKQGHYSSAFPATTCLNCIPITLHNTVQQTHKVSQAMPQQSAAPPEVHHAHAAPHDCLIACRKQALAEVREHGGCDGGLEHKATMVLAGGMRCMSTTFGRAALAGLLKGTQHIKHTHTHSWGSEGTVCMLVVEMYVQTVHSACKMETAIGWHGAQEVSALLRGSPSDAF
jgi:hypothetical protein